MGRCRTGMDENEQIEHEYQGRTWKLPRPLAQLQVTIAEADIDCRREYENAEELQAARAKRLELVLQKYRLARPWWDGFEKHERWYADWALQDYGRAHTEPAQPPTTTTPSPTGQ